MTNQEDFGGGKNRLDCWRRSKSFAELLLLAIIAILRLTDHTHMGISSKSWPQPPQTGDNHLKTPPPLPRMLGGVVAVLNLAFGFNIRLLLLRLDPLLTGFVLLPSFRNHHC